MKKQWKNSCVYYVLNKKTTKSANINELSEEKNFRSIAVRNSRAWKHDRNYLMTKADVLKKKQTNIVNRTPKCVRNKENKKTT